MDFNRPGIYKIINNINGNLYIGSAKNLRTRKKLHFNRLRRGTHDNSHLQSAFNLYGESAFEFIVLLLCDINNLLLYEQIVIDKFEPEYNIRRVAENNCGVKHSEESKRKISVSHIGNTYAKGNTSRAGKKLTSEHVRKLTRYGESNPFFGKHHSEETKQKVRDTIKRKRCENGVCGL